MQRIFLKTHLGDEISCHIFHPEKPANKLLLINSATGVKQQLYFGFANYLAQKGFVVLTYDYSGIGESKPNKLSKSKSTMRSWGTSDFVAVTDFIGKEFPAHDKNCLGHSVGALILGMNKDSLKFKKMIFVATQDAYLGHLPLKIGATATLGFGLAVPLLSSTLGYFPAQWFGLGESLPKGSALDWRTLIMHKKSTSRLFEKIEQDFSKELTQETLVVFAEDDPWVKMKGMESLMNTAYPKLNKTYREIKVSESPKRHIGHINFFRSYNKVLWKIVLDYLG